MERYTFLMTPPQLHDTVQDHCSGRSGGELSSRHSDTLTTYINIGLCTLVCCKQWKKFFFYNFGDLRVN